MYVTEIIDYIVRLGLKCNFNCLFCNVLNNEQLPEKTLEEVKSEIDKLKKRGIIVSISGGEPTLFPYLNNLIKYIKQKNFKANLQTNAVLMSEKMAKSLKASGLDMAFINFPSHSKKKYAELTKSNETNFDLAVKGIQNLIDNNIITTLNIVITNHNNSDLDDYVKFVHKHFPKINSINFSIIQPYGNAKINSHIIPDYRELRPSLEKAFDVAKELGVVIYNPYCGIPMCTAWGIIPYEKNSEYLAGLEVRKNKKISPPLRNVIKDKIHPENCYSCFLKNFCLGIWKEYKKIKGDVVEPPYRVLRYWPTSKIN